MIENYRKPRLGQKVFVYYRGYSSNWITQSTVYMKNDEEFITPTQLEDGIIDECRITFKFAEYGKTWFKSLKEVKEYLSKTIGNYKLEKITFTDCVQYDIHEKEDK